jgi:hypothetical protein
MVRIVIALIAYSLRETRKRKNDREIYMIPVLCFHVYCHRYHLCIY